MIRAAYIHIPFCHHICHYCDFNKVFMENQPVDQYLENLGKEMRLTLDESPSGNMQSIFVGGGTPTALNEGQLAQLVQTISDHLPFDEPIEYTFEANPGDLTKEKLCILKEAGVNRLSYGVQSFNDELLKAIGRTHRAKDVYQSIEEAQNLGFENISIDLIYSLPGQTLNDFHSTLTTALQLNLKHYSAYSLIVEPKTVFYNMLNRGKLHLPSEEIEAEMYELVMEEMEKNGRKQYEISNFSVPGYESIHNLTYWNNEEYYGFGAGAHSYVNGYRRSNYGPLKKYMEPLEEGKLPLMDNHQTSKVEQMEEEMFLGLRKRKGVSVDTFMRKFNLDPLELFKKQIEELSSESLIRSEEGHIRLTRKGRLLGNEVFQAFLGIE